MRTHYRWPPKPSFLKRYGFLLLWFAPIGVIGAAVAITPSKQYSSELVALYEHEIMSGNEVVFFSHYNDGGDLAMHHCEQLKAVYAAQSDSTYLCSNNIFEHNRPVNHERLYVDARIKSLAKH